MVSSLFDVFVVFVGLEFLLVFCLLISLWSPLSLMFFYFRVFVGLLFIDIFVVSSLFDVFYFRVFVGLLFIAIFWKILLSL